MENNNHRKVFISFLGTNNYVNCHYKIDGEMSAPVRFIQEALITKVCKDWTSDDKIFIFYTSFEKTERKGSKEFNWLDDGHDKINEDVEKIGLQSRLASLKEQNILNADVEGVDIVAGFSKDEIWDIFNTVNDKLEQNDEIYFDVTHAFRSIPMFSVVLFNYSKFMKGTSLKAVYYGAFEKLGPAYEVRLMPLENRVADVIDLTEIALLQEYNQVASELKYFGKIKTLSNIVSSTEEDSASGAIKQLAKSIEKLDFYIATIDLKNIKKGAFISEFRNSYKHLKNKNIFEKPIANILGELDSLTSVFDNKDSFKNIETAIKWTIKYDMLMQAYPMAAEYIILRLADIFKSFMPLELKKDKKKFRMLISDILAASEEDFQKRLWKNNPARFPQVANRISSYTIIEEIRPLYKIIKDYRNKLAHGNGELKYQDLIDGINVIDQCIGYLNNNPITIEIDEDTAIQPKHIFLNLSNHPSSEWEEAQTAAAREYGDIVDMEFPKVPTEATSKEVGEMADNTVAQLISKYNDCSLTVHVMGEMTLTYAMVGRLKSSGITCVASTTQRVATMHDNKKTSEFTFAGFREY